MGTSLWGLEALDLVCRESAQAGTTLPLYAEGTLRGVESNGLLQEYEK